MRLVLGVEYDGATFEGWQSQPGGNTVQDELQNALEKVAAEPVKVSCAGRTDAGVHALAQVVHFDTNADRTSQAWVRGVNSYLPSSVAVLWSRVISPDFHARFCAISRSYRYLILNTEVRPALASGRVGWCHRPLDVESMKVGARMLLGEHDFSAFRSSECQARSPVKTLYRANLRRNGDYLIFDFRGNAFLHHMVRNIVGALVYVGSGKHPPQWINELLLSCDRSKGAPTFAAGGLYLTRVDYEEKWRIPWAGRVTGSILGIEGES